MAIWFGDDRIQDYAGDKKLSYEVTYLEKKIRWMTAKEDVSDDAESNNMGGSSRYPLQAYEFQEPGDKAACLGQVMDVL